MTLERDSSLWRALSSPRVLGATCAGLLLSIAVALLTEQWVHFVVLATGISLAIGLIWEWLVRSRGMSRGAGLLDTPFYLAHDTEVFDRYRIISQALLRVSQNKDPIYRNIALDRLASLSGEVDEVADGTIVFEGTETWRIIYETLLRSPGLHLYRSVAWVKNAKYWQDEPGRQSMKVNFEMHDGARLSIERVVIIADELWPADEPLPVERLRQWIHEQHNHGIWIKLVRESELAQEPELVADIGIYGSRAVGTQELDDHCRTVRFILSFDFDEVTKAEERWKRLSVYAAAYADELDRFSLDE